MTIPKITERTIVELKKHGDSYYLLVPKRYINKFIEEFGDLPRHFVLEYIRDRNDLLKNEHSILIYSPLEETTPKKKSWIQRLIDVLNYPVISWGGENED